MSLEQWLQNTWLERHQPSVAQIQQLMQVVNRDISDARAQGLSADGRFQHAYNAALQLCMIALHASGYRVRKGEGHHNHGIKSLPYTLGEKWSGTADHIENCSKMRGQAMYQRIDVVSQQDADDLLETASQLRDGVIAWLKRDHSELVPADL